MLSSVELTELEKNNKWFNSSIYNEDLEAVDFILSKKGSVNISATNNINLLILLKNSDTTFDIITKYFNYPNFEELSDMMLDNILSDDYTRDDLIIQMIDSKFIDLKLLTASNFSNLTAKLKVLNHIIDNYLFDTNQEDLAVIIKNLLPSDYINPNYYRIVTDESNSQILYQIIKSSLRSPIILTNLTLSNYINTKFSHTNIVVEHYNNLKDKVNSNKLNNITNKNSYKDLLKLKEYSDALDSLGFNKSLEGVQFE